MKARRKYKRVKFQRCTWFSGIVKEVMKSRDEAHKVFVLCVNSFQDKETSESVLFFSIEQEVSIMLCFLFRIEVGLLPTYLKDKMVKNNYVHSYNTRPCNDFDLIPSVQNERAAKSFLLSGLKGFNCLPGLMKLK